MLLATDGKAKLVDFGLAADEALKPGGTKKRAARSVDYATLEDNTGAPPNDPRSDIYFLGSIYYELLSGESPFPGTKSREERKEFSRFRNVRPINTIQPGLPVYVVEAVDRLMDLNPLSRFQSPEQASQALNQVIERLGGSSSSDPDSGTETGDTEPTLLFVENRPPQQELIRDFFTSRGFRVLLVGDLQRALNRLNSSPPDCLVMMGGAIGSEIVTGFKESARRTDGRPIAQIAVLSKDQAAWEKRLGALVSETARVMAHPIVLGDLKQEIQSALAACSGRSA